MQVYGTNWPRWWVRFRGKSRLRMGFCPACYSSPPLLSCPVCLGSHLYGFKLEPAAKLEWVGRWQDVTARKKR